MQTLHGARNPAFGGAAPDPSDANLQELATIVRSGGCHLGLATDGDADRYGIIDRDGRFIEPNYILALLLKHLIATRGWRMGAARSVATSHLVDAVARQQRVPMYETKVGFNTSASSSPRARLRSAERKAPACRFWGTYRKRMVFLPPS